MKKLRVRDLCLIALFTSVTAVMAQIAIPIPFSPVPISCGMVGVYASGMMLSPHNALLSQIVYLLLGLCGAPVFHNFSGGAGILAGPTGGYLLTYPLMAITIAAYFKFAGHKWGTKTATFVYTAGFSAALFAALLLLYAGGTAYLSFLLKIPFAQALVLGVYPYIALDILKIIFCVLVLLPIRQHLAKQHLL
ncbi:MAG: biotin transporter BioY [Clostridiales bacterium]|nr:biotin transporter BioY [Clostridiales bacterium]